MGLETVVATIYADKPQQLIKCGFAESSISTWTPSRSYLASWPGTEPHYYVSRDFGPFDYGDQRGAEQAACKWLAQVAGKLETDISYRNDYSPCYD